MRSSLFLLASAASFACSPGRVGTGDPAPAPQTRADCPQRPTVRRAIINTPLTTKRVIIGVVRDAATDAPLGGGSVTLRGQQRGAAVDTVGRFQLALTAADTGRQILVIRQISFEQQADTIGLSASGGMSIEVFLTYFNICLDPVVGGTVVSPRTATPDSVRRVP